jgi:hypothetical protein
MGRATERNRSFEEHRQSNSERGSIHGFEEHYLSTNRRNPDDSAHLAYRRKPNPTEKLVGQVDKEEHKNISHYQSKR